MRRSTPSRLALGAWLSATLLLAACEDTDPPDEPADGFDVSVSLDPVVPTVATVVYSHPDDDGTYSGAYVLFGAGADNDSFAPAAPTGDGAYRAVLLGLRPETEVRFVPFIGGAGHQLAGGERTLTTGARPTSLPDLTVTSTDPDGVLGGFWIVPILTPPSSVAIVDAEGEYVWWHTTDDRASLTVISRAAVSRDGEWVLFLDRTAVEGGQSTPALFRVRLDRTDTVIQPVAGAHHDFVELPDGTVALIVEDVRSVGEQTVHGDAIVELAGDGTERVVWSVWDHEEYSGDVEDGDWTHANGLDFDEDRDAYVLSMRNIDAIYRIGRSTGEVEVRLGGPASDVARDDGEGPLFVAQHQFHLEDHQLLVFDNGDDAEASSRVVGYQFNPLAGTATETFLHTRTPAVFCYSLGDVAPLQDDGHMVVWSTAGVIERLDADGEVVWELSSEIGAGFGYSTWLESLAPASYPY